VISVGGVRHYNTLSTADDAWAFGGSTGPAADGRIKPDLNYWYDSIYTTTTNNGYTTSFGGTSAATPEVAGVLGLVVQLWSDNVFGTNPAGTTVFERQPHASTIKALLINTARSTRSPAPATTSPASTRVGADRAPGWPASGRRTA
jgi:serine protease AprX